MYSNQSQLPPWVNPVVIGGAVSLLAAYLGFWDYIQPTESGDLCYRYRRGRYGSRNRGPCPHWWTRDFIWSLQALGNPQVR